MNTTPTGSPFVPPLSLCPSATSHPFSSSSLIVCPSTHLDWLSKNPHCLSLLPICQETHQQSDLVSLRQAFYKNVPFPFAHRQHKPTALTENHRPKLDFPIWKINQVGMAKPPSQPPLPHKKRKKKLHTDQWTALKNKYTDSAFFLSAYFK